HLLGLGVVEPSQDVGEEGFRIVRGHEFGRRRALASTLKCGWHIVLSVLPSSNPCGWRNRPTYFPGLGCSRANPHWAGIRLQKIDARAYPFQDPWEPPRERFLG